MAWVGKTGGAAFRVAAYDIEADVGEGGLWGLWWGGEGRGGYGL